jgi:23S rRNA (uracil1939-C5)-methyltransferase
MKTLRIEKMIYGGNGVAESGETLPFVLPEELVQPEAGAFPNVIEASPDRVAPECVHFGACGGCHYQHANYPAQLEIKRAILLETFAAAGITELPKIEVHSGDPWHYRNRIRLRVGEVDGELRVGYNRAGSSGGEAMLPVTMCSIASPILWRAAEAVVALAKTDAAVRGWLAAAVELEFFTNDDESALQLVLFTRRPPAAGFGAFCKALQKSIPQLEGAGVALLPKNPSPQGRRAEHAKSGPQWGTPGILYRVGNDRHWVSRGAFFQVNRHVVAQLLRLAVGERKGALAWDLYAGVGLFSRALASTFETVVAVEAGQPAATDLAAALKGKKHRAVAMTTLEFLQAAVIQRERPDLIVMDPPRAGVGAEVCALLARVRCPEIVYVSCDPVTLARDLKQLTGDGYKLVELNLVDMFPQTFHMETVSVLRR